MSTSFGWEGKDRYGSFRKPINVGCAGKTVRTRVVPERLKGVFTTRRYTNPRLPYLTLPLRSSIAIGPNNNKLTHSVSV